MHVSFALQYRASKHRRPIEISAREKNNIIIKQWLQWQQYLMTYSVRNVLGPNSSSRMGYIDTASLRD